MNNSTISVPRNVREYQDDVVKVQATYFENVAQIKRCNVDVEAKRATAFAAFEEAVFALREKHGIPRLGVPALV